MSADKLIRDDRKFFVNTLPDTMNLPGAKINNGIKEYSIGKYNSKDVKNDIYDVLIKKSSNTGQNILNKDAHRNLDTKFVNTEGNINFNNWLKSSLIKDNEIIDELNRRSTNGDFNGIRKTESIGKSHHYTASYPNNINDFEYFVNKNPNYKTMEEISKGLKSDRISKKDVLKIKEGIRKDIDGVMPNTSKIEAMLINALGGKK